MGRIELRLIPAPGSKPEFLAVVEPTNNDNSPPIWKSITNHNKVIILEGYTRDAWALDTATKWVPLQVKSIDGRNKLKGFVDYLRERQKTCFGRFVATADDDSNNVTTYVWVISHKQASSTQLNCRIAPINAIPKCPLRPKSSTLTSNLKIAAATATSSKSSAASASAPTVASSSSSKPKKKGFGILGNLVGAQRRTNHSVVASVTTQQPATGKSSSNTSSHDNHQEDLKTSGQVLADFRHEMEQKMLDFDIADDVSMKVDIKLSDHSKKVQDVDKGKMSMDVLKYIVYEQAEECNEEWIAHKEQSEFTDEITIAIYKDPEDAPPEVLEELNQAELPDEMKAEQRKIENKRRQDEMKELRIQELLQRQALRKMATGSGSDVDEGGGAGDFTVLNKDKRDLRTIEEIQQDTKRQKVE
ncbi:hypothetical protein FRACYDRAFT_223442 [Fragilariopsis cylindrus CCMP1102]|uniref:Uncharacterized protein n=1 Tax=Fragilariopsis cylindrus CCMP1102 TaxID=635003 RepID=A0A1E7FW83_9STRA|nr:hypothetical protein FRACYDRAFT_223442 [Fragilariopsis cylindrus CCMP1102]|eukprot:OEU22421.1 hypothetical protein FRACYDRAFT_223442 [Fragilariopsis cylindrus CCMP1102]